MNHFSRITWIVTVAGGAILLSSQLNLNAECVSPPSGLVSWWPAEGNASDIQGTNNGTFNGPVFAPGEVAQAFSFDGSGNNVRIPASASMDVGAGGGMTIEAWIFSTDNSTGRPIVEWVPQTAGAFGAHFYAHASGPGALYANLYDTDNNSHIIETAPGTIQLNTNQHVAVTYDKASGIARLFVNGAKIIESTLGTFTPQTSPDLSIGFRPSTVPFGPIPFLGRIDEVSLYSRALTSSEIQSIYNAGQAGKCPLVPVILAQPTDQTVIVGARTSFNVLASGSPPLNYQWTMGGTNVPGATDASLLLTNIQTSEAGTYAVLVTNDFGSIVSSNAVLVVNPAPPCATLPAGLVSWWPGEGNANDNEGANNGTFTNSSYAAGEVGEAFNFDGSGNNVRVPASFSMDVGAGDGMTIEAWIFSTDNSLGRPIVEWVPQTAGAFGAHFYAHASGPGALYANLYDTARSSHVIQSAPGVIQLNANQHVAVTYDKASGIARLFVNGAQVAQSSLGTFTPQTSPDLSIGYRPSTVPFGPTPFIGRIDEVSLYSRALAPSEIQTIYNGGAAGKCNVPVAPSIFGQPTDQTRTIGQTASFQIQAGGTLPLSYQWFFNSTNSIDGATNAFLVLTNVQMSQAGSYSVLVTNAYGTALSSNADLVVNFPPAAVRIVNVSGTAGSVVTVPVVVVANGNENAVGFSLSFSPALLTNAGVSLGTGASGASLVVNPNQAGEIGVGVALHSGATFAAGTQEVAEISFIAAASTTNFSIGLTFGDLPTARVLSDANAKSLPVTFAGGQISLARSEFEADVASRPNGDGQVNILDWVQVGRFVAALDSPTNTSEFQRADCAPRNTSGDGLLTVSDWVQAGRYAAGLNKPTVAGGPTGPTGGTVVTRAGHKRGNPQDILTVEGPIIFQGQTGTAFVNLNAQGDENAVGFSLSFDPAIVTYAGASAGADAANTTMEINTSQAASGRVGIILALPQVTLSFSPGPRQLVKVNFQAVTQASIDATVALTDMPVSRDVSDTNANSVVTSYNNGIISVNPRPSLAIGQSSQSLSLAWPLWATNYNLQEAVGATTGWANLNVSPVLTNNALNVTLPLTNSVQFYRLQHQ